MHAVSHKNPALIRRFAIAAATALLAAVAIAGPLAPAATAAPTIITVSDVTEFQNAITQVNSANGADSTADDFTIVLDNNIDFTDVTGLTLSYTGGTDAHNVVIDGDDHSITCDDGAGSCGYLLESYMRVEASLTFTDITISGFRNRAVYLEDSDLTITDTEFSDNSVTGGSGAIWGGAVYARNYYGTPGAVIVTIADSKFSDNVAVGDNAYGGALYLSVAQASITNARFEDNIAQALAGSSFGGAVGVEQGVLNVHGSYFDRNESTGGADNGHGGAISVSSGLLTTSGTVFTDNSSDGYGGAVYANNFATASGYVANQEARFDGNSAVTGGAVAIHGPLSQGSFDTVQFADNSAVGDGGAIWVQSGSADIVAALFQGNSAANGGGVTSANSADVNIANSTFTENVATDGGAAVRTWALANIELDHVTIAGNSVPSGSGDSYDGGQILNTGGSSVLLFGTVVVDTQGGGVACSFSTGEPPTSDGYNFVDDTSCGLGGTGDTESLSADAELGPLQFNGGSTWTMVPDQGSDLINSIPVSDCDANYDQRDVEREQDYACDAGAVETFEPIYLSIATPGGLTQIRILNAVSVLDGGSMPTASLPSGLTAGVAFPYGGMTLELDVWGRGWPVDIDYFTPAPTTTFWKYLDGEWDEYPAAYDDQMWTFRLTDGGLGDDDGVADGVIVDPWAAGVAAAFTG